MADQPCVDCDAGQQYQQSADQSEAAGCACFISGEPGDADDVDGQCGCCCEDGGIRQAAKWQTDTGSECEVQESAGCHAEWSSGCGFQFAVVGEDGAGGEAGDRCGGDSEAGGGGDADQQQCGTEDCGGGSFDASRGDRPFRPFSGIEGGVEDIIQHHSSEVQSGGGQREQTQLQRGWCLSRAGNETAAQDIGDRGEYGGKPHQSEPGQHSCCVSVQS